jgi:hypothetical protein
MDDRLEKALAFSNYRITIENRRIALKRRFETMIVVHHNDGVFTADSTTIGFAATLLLGGHTEAILIDTRGNTIQVNDLLVFKDKLMNAYFMATNEYSVDLAKLATARNVKKVMDW